MISAVSTGKFIVLDHGWHQAPLNKHKFSFFMISSKILKQVVQTLSFLKSLSNSTLKCRKLLSSEPLMLQKMLILINCLVLP